MTNDIEQKTKALQEKLLPNQNEETYKIFEYFSNNVPLLLTVGSTMVALGVAFINLLSYLTQYRYLEYWNIDASILQTNNKTTTFYTIVISITYSLALSLIALWLPKFSKNMYIHDITMLYYKLGLKCNKSNLRSILRNKNQCVRQLKKHNKTLDKLKKSSGTDACPEDSTEYKNINHIVSNCVQAIQLCDSELNKILESIKSIKLNIRREHILRLLTTILYILQFGGLIYLINILYSLSIFFSSTNPLIIAAVLLLIEIILVYTGVKIISFAKRCKYKIKSSIINVFDSEKTDELTAMDFSIALANLIIIKNDHETIGEKIKKALSDKSIKNALMQIFLVVCISSLSFFITNEMNIKNDKTFPITVYDNNDYAVIYNDGNTIIIEDVTIEGNTIKIYTNSQCMLFSQGLSYEIIEFQKVEIIRESTNNKFNHENTKKKEMLPCVINSPHISKITQANTQP